MKLYCNASRKNTPNRYLLI